MTRLNQPSALCLAFLLLVVSCAGSRQRADVAVGNAYASNFAVGNNFVVSVSPFDGTNDTLWIEHPLTSVVCMSSTQVAGFDMIGAGRCVSGVSGLDFISSPSVLARRDSVIDVGYDQAFDFEKVMQLHPDVVLSYATSQTEPSYVGTLRGLGIRVFNVYDNIEAHPLARAEYIRLYGLISGRSEAADSLFADISARYEALSKLQHADTCKVLINTPYAGAWYVPSPGSYMARLVHDAGGKILGMAHDGDDSPLSSTISLEEACQLAPSADYWLNVGSQYPSIASLSSAGFLGESHLADKFPLKEGKVYDNTARTNPAGGNDFWESGAMRPDLVLQDLVRIMHPLDMPADYPDSLIYYVELH